MISQKALIGAVFENNTVVGAITLGDLVRTLSAIDGSSFDFSTQIAGEHMSANPVTVSHLTICTPGEEIMQRQGVNSLIVLDDHGSPVGAYDLYTSL